MSVFNLFFLSFFFFCFWIFALAIVKHILRFAHFRFNGNSLGATLARGVRISSAEDATWETFAALSHRTKDVAVDAGRGQPQQLAKKKMREREREECYASVQTSHGLGFPNSRGNPLSLSLSLSLPPEVVAFGRGEHWAERAEIREISITCCAQFICTLGLDRLAVLLQEWPRRREREGKRRGWGSWGNWGWRWSKWTTLIVAIIATHIKARKSEKNEGEREVGRETRTAHEMNEWGTARKGGREEGWV